MRTHKTTNALPPLSQDCEIESPITKEVLNLLHADAEAGDMFAQHCLGFCYDHGIDVSYLDPKDRIDFPKDAGEAVKWYRLAADQGYADAQLDLAVCYSSGEGVAKDPVVAARLFQQAAEQGVASAQLFFGNCLEFGNGVAKDEAAAIKWYRKSARQGDNAAQLWLGECYYFGIGVRKNLDRACYWHAMATEDFEE